MTVTLNLDIVNETEVAILVTPDTKRNAAWVRRSDIEIQKVDGFGRCRVVMPIELARAKGLVRSVN